MGGTPCLAMALKLIWRSASEAIDTGTWSIRRRARGKATPRHRRLLNLSSASSEPSPMPIEARPTSLMVRLFILPVVAPSSDGVSSVAISSLLVLSWASACVILVSLPVSSSLISELALSTAICASVVLLSAKGVWASSWSVALSRRLAASSIASALPASLLSSMTTKLTSFSLVDRTVRSSGSSCVCA